MTPVFCTKLAQRLFPVRWWLLATSIGFMLPIGMAIAFAGRWGSVAVVLIGPLIGLPWAGLCVATWFDPERGTLRPGDRRLRDLPPSMQAFRRWFGAVFLTVFAVFCGLVLPIAVLSGH